MDIGTTLRVAREQRAISLPQLAATTKVPIALLRALEENAFEKMPAGIFVRGYIRAYAREVGLNPEDTVARFLEETGQAAAAAAADAHPPLDADLDEMDVDRDLSDSSRAGWGYVLMVAALLVAIISFNRSGTPDGTAPAPDLPVAEAPATAVQPAVLPVDDRPVATTGGGLHIEIQAVGLCWVRAVVDGKMRAGRLMQPGDRDLFEADREVILRVGDPAALTHSVNGRAGEPLGRSGIPVTIRFTNEGERIVLAS